MPKLVYSGMFSWLPENSPSLMSLSLSHYLSFVRLENLENVPQSYNVFTTFCLKMVEMHQILQTGLSLVARRFKMYFPITYLTLKNVKRNLKIQNLIEF